MLSTIKTFDQLPLVLNVVEMAQVLGISRKLAYQLVHRNDFPAVRVSKRRIVIPTTKLRDWINGKAQEPLD